MNELMIKVENVSKQYRLGQIGGTTMRDTLKRKVAKVRHQEDPTKKVDEVSTYANPLFLALDDISFEVKKGERVGIIGHNGAGKSTLLKLLSRVTAPSEGTIGLNGRIASMLEVGTGFHPELTGRENIYMNGAILGMTKREIDEKIEDIIEFSECRKFIDTPVKRYSSGMYVKLAFSVAAHLDSEIMIMDEVLAVGDMAFQKKCLDKMREVAEKHGRTILYVSHNMNTIRQLCDRCIVLNKGKVVFDGDVEEAISLYIGKIDTGFPCVFDLKDSAPVSSEFGVNVKALSFEFLNKKNASYIRNEIITFKLCFKVLDDVPDLSLYFHLHSENSTPVGMTYLNKIIGKCNKGNIYSVVCSFDVSNLAPGIYYCKPEICTIYPGKSHVTHEIVPAKIAFEVVGEFQDGIKWLHSYFGYVRLNLLELNCVKEGLYDNAMETSFEEKEKSSSTS